MLQFFSGEVGKLSPYFPPISHYFHLHGFSSVATGVRGGTFSLTMARLNLRIRKKLFKTILSQEIGFFDTTRTGKYCKPAFKCCLEN